MIILKILVVSDNHGDRYALKELYEIYKNEVDYWLHCGDSEFGQTHDAWKIFKTVEGNMDISGQFPLVRVENFEDNNFVVVHGHKHQVKRSTEPMKKLALEHDSKVVFYGHTHVAKVTSEDGRYFINPGSISEPRGHLPKGSYAIYEETKEETAIQFFDWNHDKLPELSQKLAL